MEVTTKSSHAGTGQGSSPSEEWDRKTYLPPVGGTSYLICKNKCRISLNNH